MEPSAVTENLPFNLAVSAAALDAVEAVSAVMPLVAGSSPRRTSVAIDWLFQTYLPAWMAEAGISCSTSDLAAVDRAANDAWTAMRARVRASVPKGAWSALRETVRDTVRETMQPSVEAAVRLPIETVEWSRIERQTWSAVEACLWVIAWRALLAGTDSARARIQVALEPRKEALQRSAVALLERMATVPVPRAVTPHVEDGVLFGAQDHVLVYMQQRLPGVRDFGPCNALGIVRDGRLIGGVVFNNYHPEIGDIEISAAFDTSAWFRPRTVRRVFAFPFVDLQCRRLTDNVRRGHKPARAFAVKAGFKLEGVKRRGFDGRQDLMIYGMLREECRFLRTAA